MKLAAANPSTVAAAPGAFVQGIKDNPAYAGGAALGMAIPLPHEGGFGAGQWRDVRAIKPIAHPAWPELNMEQLDAHKAAFTDLMAQALAHPEGPKRNDLLDAALNKKREISINEMIGSAQAPNGSVATLKTFMGDEHYIRTPKGWERLGGIPGVDIQVRKPSAVDALHTKIEDALKTRDNDKAFKLMQHAEALGYPFVPDRPDWANGAHPDAVEAQIKQIAKDQVAAALKTGDMKQGWRVEDKGKVLEDMPSTMRELFLPGHDIKSPDWRQEITARFSALPNKDQEAFLKAYSHWGFGIGTQRKTGLMGDLLNIYRSNYGRP
jgi:hypothetical protein